MHFSVLMAHRGHTAVHSGEKALELYSENLPAETGCTDTGIILLICCPYFSYTSSR